MPIPHPLPHPNQLRQPKMSPKIKRFFSLGFWGSTSPGSLLLFLSLLRLFFFNSITTLGDLTPYHGNKYLYGDPSQKHTDTHHTHTHTYLAQTFVLNSILTLSIASMTSPQRTSRHLNPEVPNTEFLVTPLHSRPISMAISLLTDAQTKNTEFILGSSLSLISHIRYIGKSHCSTF